MLNWKKIYELNENNNKKAGTAFEQLALEYLSNVYGQYSWKNTKSSWDGNRDFVSLMLDNIWGEAKYKKDSSALRRQDVDPTMISGFLDGKIKLVFIITNGTIPQTINARINETAIKCGFTVVCITQIQLEYWLIAHPKQYNKFFKEKLPPTHSIDAVSIDDVRLECRLEAGFESSYIEPEFVEGNIYHLCITFCCNTQLDCTINEKPEYPFQFLDSPKIQLSPGIQERCFIVKVTRESSKPIILEFIQADGTILQHVLDIRIISNKNPKLIYSQQEFVKMNICDTLRRLPEGDFNHIIALQGKTGYGKTFLMREMAKDLSFSFVVAVLQCLPQSYVGINCMKLCQTIIYFNYGDIYHKTDENDRENKDFYKYLLLKNNHEKIISDELLLDIFEGCFDRIIAKNVIKRLSKDSSAIIIKNSRFARRHILLIDDIHLLTPEESSVFKMILLQLKCNYNNSGLIFSYENFLCDEVEIFPYKLEGLKEGDIIETLKFNLTEQQYLPFCSIVEKLPRQPQMLSEVVSFMKGNFITQVPYVNINEYITQIHNNRLSNFKFSLTEKEKIIMELIFNFPNGISENLFSKVKIEKEILLTLCDKGCIIYFDCRYFPCLDYFYYTYKNQYRNFVVNEKSTKYLCELLDNACEDSMFDTFRAQTLLLQCNPQLYSEAKKTFKNKIFHYINMGQYREAMLYGELFSFDILNAEEQRNKIDLEALFYYGIASIHCDSQRRAIEIFTYIKNNAKKNSLLFFRASAELLNNKYSRFQIDNTLSEAIALKYAISSSLKRDADENSLDTHQLRIAYSTCQNRLMMIYFLLDDYENATSVYNNFCAYHSSIPSCIFTDKYDSMLLEWKMDYARGSALYDFRNAVELDEYCYNNFSENLDFRRKVLCKMDMIFLQAIENRNYDYAISELILCKQNLVEKGIVSENMKASIKIAYCRLMKYVSIPELNNVVLLAPFVEEIYSEVFCTQLETRLIVQGRTGYILNNLLAVLHLIKGEISCATEQLDHNLRLIKSCGIEYRRIIQHNLQHLNYIKKIDWYHPNTVLYPDTYYLDIRVW